MKRVELEERKEEEQEGLSDLIQYTQGNKETSQLTGVGGWAEVRLKLETQQREIIKQLEEAGCLAEAKKLKECGTRALVFKHLETGKIQGWLQSCDSRFCVYCNRARVSRVRDRYGDLLWEIANGQFLTFTQRDVLKEEESLREARERLLEGFERLRRSYWWRESVAGGLYSVEMTEHESKWHVHLHCILDMKTDWIKMFKHEEGEKEDSYLPRLKEHQEECESLLSEIRSLARRIGRVKDEAKKEELAEELRKCRERYLKSQTLTGLWYRATKGAAEKRGVGVEGAYVIWFEILRRDSIAEVVKYSCKPMCLTGEGLAEAVELLSGSHLRMLESFGNLRDKIREDNEERPKDAKYAFLGTVESLARSAGWNAGKGEDPQKAIDQASAVVEVIEDGLESVKKEKWVRQAERVLEIAVNWPSWLVEVSELSRLERMLQEEKEECLERNQYA